MKESSAILLSIYAYVLVDFIVRSQFKEIDKKDVIVFKE